MKPYFLTHSFIFDHMTETKRESDQIHPNAMEDDDYEERYFEHQGIKLYYECKNVVDKEESTVTPILFLHGWTANRLRLHPIYILYANEGKPVFRLDLRGHGWSQKKGIADFSLMSMKNDLDAFIRTVIIDQFGFEKVNICAHSMGGSITQMLAIENPSYLEKIILLASSAQWTDSIWKKIKWWAYNTLYRLNHDKLYMKKKAGHEIHGLHHFPMWFDKYNTKNRTLFTEPTATIQGIREMRKLNLRPSLSSINIPALIVAGENDVDAPVSYSNKMFQLIPHSRIVVISDVNHDIAIGKPLTLKTKMDEFLET